MHPMLTIMLMDAHKADRERRVRASRSAAGRARSRHARSGERF